MNIDTLKSTPSAALYDAATTYLGQKDYTNYVIYMTMAANLGNTDAILHLDHEYSVSLTHKKQDYLTTKSFYEQTVAYSYSANYLGTMYHSGLGVPVDYAKAKELYEMAIAGGNCFSMHNLGYMYNIGEGVPVDYAKAKELYEMAIAGGNTDAMHNLGYMYTIGEGVPVDYAKAKELYGMAIAGGNTAAMFNLGCMYHHGQGVPVDYAKTKELYEKAIAGGNTEAMHNLGYMYHHGQGVPIDYAKAKELYEMAIAGGNTIAIHGLILLHKTCKLFDKQQVTNYFIKIGHAEKLKGIYNYTEEHIRLLVDHKRVQDENKRLENENSTLKAHIEASPDDPHFLDLTKEWSAKIKSIDH